MNQYALHRTQSFYTHLVLKIKNILVGINPVVEFWVIAFVGAVLSFTEWALDKQKSFNKRNLANACAMLIFKTWKMVFGLTYEAKGFESLPAGAKIIAINHTNASDVIFLPLLLSRMPRMIAQGDLFDVPVFGNILKATGQIPVHPDNPTQAFEQAHELLQRGETLVIFPEGQLVPYGQRVKAKSGAVRLSLATGAPIIPLGIYTDPNNLKALHLTKGGREREGLYQVKGACHLHFGAAWKPSPMDRKPSQVHALTDELMDRIYALVEQGRKESQNMRIHKDLKMVSFELIWRLFYGSKINYQ